MCSPNNRVLVVTGTAILNRGEAEDGYRWAGLPSTMCTPRFGGIDRCMERLEPPNRHAVTLKPIELWNPRDRELYLEATARRRQLVATARLNSPTRTAARVGSPTRAGAPGGSPGGGSPGGYSPNSSAASVPLGTVTMGYGGGLALVGTSVPSPTGRGHTRGRSPTRGVSPSRGGGSPGRTGSPSRGFDSLNLKDTYVPGTVDYTISRIESKYSIQPWRNYNKCTVLG